MLKRASLVALSLCVFTSVASAQRIMPYRSQGKITVNGNGSSTYTPRNAKFRLGSAKTALTAQQASSQSALAVQQLKGKLMRLGVKASQIKLGSASTRPNYKKNTNGTRSNIVKDWTTRQDVSVKVPFKSKKNLIGEVYSAATQVKDINISGPSADVVPKSYANAQKRARSSAVRDAVSEAKRQLKGVATLGNLLEVKPANQGGGYYPRGMAMETAARGAPAQVNPEFSGANAIRVSESVSATFSLNQYGLRPPVQPPIMRPLNQ